MATTNLAEDVARGNLDVLQHERRRRRAVYPELVLFLTRTHPGEGPLDEKRRELLAVDFRKNNEQIGESPVGDPHLFAAEDEAAVRLARGASLGAKCVGSGAGLAEGIGADGFAADQAWQESLLLVLGAEAKEWCDCQPGLRAEGRGKGRGAPDRFADDDCRDLVQFHPAVLLGHVSAKQAELTAAPDERARERPVLLLEPLEHWQHLVDDELDSRLADQPVFIAQPLGREDRLARVFNQPLPAARRDHGGRHYWPSIHFGPAKAGHYYRPLSQWSCFSRPFAVVVSGFRPDPPRIYNRSKIPAAPIPPPTHIVTIPYLDPRRRISCSSVAVNLAPVHPSGWPRAMAPPLTLRRAGSIAISRRQASA